MRQVSGAVRGTVAVLKIKNRRELVRYLRHESLRRAVRVSDDVSPARVNEVVWDLEEVLDETPLPHEPSAGIVNWTRRQWNEKAARGVRYPEHRGRWRQTFAERLYAWAKNAARSQRAGDGLDRVGFQGGEDRQHVFALRLVAATEEILLEEFHDKGPDRIRLAMADEIFHGISDVQRERRRRELRALLRSSSAGIAAAALAAFGFNTDWLDSITLGVVAGAAAGAADIAQAGWPGLTVPMRAARQQAAHWLRMFAGLLVPYLAATNESIRAERGGDVAALVRILATLRVSGIDLSEMRGRDKVLDSLEKLKANAERTQDGELQAALIYMETAIDLCPELLPDAVAGLLTLIQAAQEDAAAGRAPLIPARRVPQIGTAEARADHPIPQARPAG
ncbi:hypothetical protein Asi02nite_57890 [Asanoa siamensis]|uniref:Uncharacterized protein n=1 Tax=Asanoa siamensis TaxID=926357 RepID=A0ABQ4CY95_9ACTN|nr:hypothetical protein Asi02nite_57890 [Asanoa siamensis]